MSFSFNWSGLQVPTIKGGDNGAKAAETAALFGKAAVGADRMIANKEYKDILAGMPQESEQIIMAEIQRLEARNAEIRRMLGVGVSG